MYKKSLILLATVVFGLVGCNKEDADLTAPTVVVQQPSTAGVNAPINTGTNVNGQVSQTPVTSVPAANLQIQNQPTTQVAPISEQQNVGGGSLETQVAPPPAPISTVQGENAITTTVTQDVAVPTAPAPVVSNPVVSNVAPTPGVNDQIDARNVVQQNGPQVSDNTGTVVPSVVSGNANPVSSVPVRQVPVHHQTVGVTTNSKV